MNIEHYLKYIDCKEKGLKQEATKCLRLFITSFENSDEIDKWVWEYLPNLSAKSYLRIRHEIFHELVLPVLKAGYQRGDINCTLWLGKLIQNIYEAPKVHEDLGWVTAIELFGKCNDLAPNHDEARHLLLQSLVSWLEYTEHEWPRGILYENDGATLEQVDEISLEVQRVLMLDHEHQYREFIKQYNKKLIEYRARLSK
tara:strand:- start:2850 stop:3446 length:597 start_codon:yes stop_codon:yes gene_type:complete